MPSINPTRFTIIVPIYNEELFVESKSTYFDYLQRECEVIFVDGNSSDNTVSLLESYNFKVIHSPRPSRGLQLQMGINQSSGDILLFHHFDSKLSVSYQELIRQALQDRSWGHFDVKLSGNNWLLRLVEKFMNFRARVSGIATGDQAIFVRKDICDEFVSNLQNLPIMEDIYLCKQLKKSTNPACISTPVISSARYWEKNGIVRSILRMWALRLLYFFGVSPKSIYALYYR